MFNLSMKFFKIVFLAITYDEKSMVLARHIKVTTQQCSYARQVNEGYILNVCQNIIPEYNT